MRPVLIPGLRVGCLRLVRPDGARVGTNQRWLCDCVTCGRTVAIWSTRMSRLKATGRTDIGCRHCMAEANKSTDPERGICRWCNRVIRQVRVERPTGSVRVGYKNVRECFACSRRAARNGRGPDGAPCYRKGPTTASPPVLRDGAPGD